MTDKELQDRLVLIQDYITKLDALIDDTLDREPDAAAGSYGKKISELFEAACWIDSCIMR